MNAVTLGECLRTADRHFEAAMTPHGGGILDRASSARELRRLVTVMARYLDGAVVGDASALVSGSSQNGWERAAIEQRAALRLAADCLDDAAASEHEPRSVCGPGSPPHGVHRRTPEARKLRSHVPNSGDLCGWRQSRSAHDCNQENCGLRADQDVFVPPPTGPWGSVSRSNDGQMIFKGS
jgi:hypothetical protein